MTGRPLTSDERAAGAANTRIGTELVSETAGLRIWHLRLQPGKSLPAHRHDRPYIWTVLTDGAATSRYGDGRIVDMTYRAGETRHFPDLTPQVAFVHDLTNTGETKLVFVTVEFDPHDTQIGG